MAQEDVSTFLRHVEEEIEGIKVFCLANTLVNAEEALLQSDALLRDVVAFTELFHTEESASDNLVQAIVDVVQAVQVTMTFCNIQQGLEADRKYT